MQGDILFINKNHVTAAKNTFEQHLEEKLLNKYIITVTGEAQSQWSLLRGFRYIIRFFHI